MVSRLLDQLEINPIHLIRPDPGLFVKLIRKSCGVFHVPQALGSPFVPAQEEFVVKYGIASALGFGGVIPHGDIFVVILFTRVPVSREVAARFQTLSLHAKTMLLPFFAGSAPSAEAAPAGSLSR